MYTYIAWTNIYAEYKLMILQKGLISFPINHKSIIVELFNPNTQIIILHQQLSEMLKLVVLWNNLSITVVRRTSESVFMATLSRIPLTPANGKGEPLSIFVAFKRWVKYVRKLFVTKTLRKTSFHSVTPPTRMWLSTSAVAACCWKSEASSSY